MWCKDVLDVFGDWLKVVEMVELVYFWKFMCLVQCECWYVDQDLVDLFDDSWLEFCVKNFCVICGVRIVLGAELFIFEFDYNIFDLECGDSVLIYLGWISSIFIYYGYV